MDQDFRPRPTFSELVLFTGEGLRGDVDAAGEGTSVTPQPSAVGASKLARRGELVRRGRGTGRLVGDVVGAA